MNGRIKSIEEKLPIMGFIDLVGVAENDLCDVKYKFKNINIKPNAMEEHSITVEIETEMFCRVFGNKEVKIIQDMYSPSKNLKLNQNNISTMVNMQSTKEIVNIREKIKLDNSEYSKICDVFSDTVINEKSVLKDMIKYSGDLNLKFILSNDDETSIRMQEVNVPFSFSQEIEGIDRDSEIECEMSRNYQEFTKDNNDVSVKLDLEVCTNSYNVADISVIEGAEETEEGEDNPYSMVIYFVKPGDSLWKIAKRYRSTVQDIARINGIENVDRIGVGAQLFIPKATPVI